MHKQRVFIERGMFIRESNPVSEYLGEHGVYLPTGVTLTYENVETIASIVKDIKRS
jgi:dTDP-4-amino-4,6-dideoxygalactose transaminase